MEVIIIAGYTLTQQSVTGINGESVTCGHLTCTEKSTLRLNDVLRESGDYYFQMKIKSKAAATVQLYIGTSIFNFSTTTSFIHFTQLCSNINTAPHKYIEIVFPIGEYWFYNMQLESGNIMTAWAFCMDDLKDELGAHTSWIEQTNQKIQMFVQRNELNQTKTEMQLTADGMITEALKSYVTSDDFGNYKIEQKTQLEQLSDKFTIYITKDIYNGLDKTVSDIKSKQDNYFQFSENGLTIGKKSNPYQVVISNEEYQMLSNGNKLMYIKYGELMIPDAVITRKLRLLGYSFELDELGNMNCQYVGSGG